MTDAASFTAFTGHCIIARGGLARVAAAAAAASEPVLIFDDSTGAPVELDFRRGAPHAVAEFHARTGPAEIAVPRPGRGRPRLGVVAREVTLLPRHWTWLATQPGGASAALRRLVEAARLAAAGPDEERRKQESIYRVMVTLAGDLPGFEDASRALFAGDEKGLLARIASWPADVATYLEALLGQPGSRQG